ncbi:hypothetical protein BGZ74_003628 [Mortierella antarctica]|nr:hypothetical protein BGZ74_003628 [Mortierella antarctica]
MVEDIEDDSEIGIASKDPSPPLLPSAAKPPGSITITVPEPVVALSARMMGPESWDNSFCGRRVRVVNRSHPGHVVIGRIVDKCPGDECAFGSLYLSPAAFKQLGHLDTGVLNVTWNFV